MKAVYLTAGAAGMFCGSCMHDNALAAALQRLGVDAMLVPLYTPIRTDEGNVSIDRVFFSGVSVFLQQRVPLFRHLPGFVDRFLESPALLRWATSGSATMNYRDLGALAVSMLQGRHGHQRREVEKLAAWLAGEEPDVVCLSNVLIAGSVPAIREKLPKAALIATLQGDDVFLDELPEPYQSQCVEQIRRLVPYIDGFIVNSEFYGRKMGKRFAIPPEKLHVVPLAIDTRELSAIEPEKERTVSPRRIGYLARLAPEKGLHLLVDAFIRLKQLPGTEDVELHVAGWLGDHRKEYASEQWRKLDAADLSGRWKHHGELDRAEKLEFLRSLSLFSVPATFEEPKGLYALEAMALGLPVVLPDHGAFPEMLSRVEGGRLFAANDAQALAHALHDALADEERLRRWSETGRSSVLGRLNETAMAEETRALFERLLAKGRGPAIALPPVPAESA
ncbi:MAG TPA: glycosyltransferase family 4 protein [Pirellulaceae bacterium]|jgi:glycosyltransferase involved in cell wall biosynthesis|nr:glycosyltransferase family 4 protein [Pirellulaceae bacterium]